MSQPPSVDRHVTLRRVLAVKAVVGVAVAFGLAGGFWLRARGLSIGELATEMRRSEPRYAWTPVDRKHWEAATLPSTEERPELTEAREQTGAGCPIGMVRVKGQARMEHHGEQTGEIERIQDAACTDWISRDFPARCRSFDPTLLATEVAKLPTRAMDYCIDRFEYPNVMGRYPMIVVTFHEAEALCKKASKRLCTETEWTFACEGEESRPYPYGFTRDATACVIDRPWRPFKEGALQPRDGQNAREELDRLWQGEPSGSRGACRSPFGVYDMTGNVDEWTRSVRPTGYTSVLKGGYWGPVRARCRPATRAHNEDFVAYQQSFRCCSESNASVPAPVAVPPVARLADAGAPLGPAAARADAGATPASADLRRGSGWDEEGDEIDALRRARVGLACVSNLGGEAPSASPLLTFAVAVLAVAIARRRSRAS